ncbi:hypothetical protein YPC_0312 [Yersinia pestis biovar Medievalis str. Harbin 35]|nr:hypothetical protein YPC_0312 [Yersinia pestis biovar Medievalis str. Harbin 35]
MYLPDTLPYKGQRSALCKTAFGDFDSYQMSL